ncbi:30S ribosomal protein S19e [Candidatus Micrarchaeota archaeon CG_4_10_14_0_2_um_filter_60_11]|nr:MAG: hypothetical protein AUJ16_03475 [Candidatus Micrarchaeota archaeon CG1_02_60_51]PIN95774.1 MAG: 30S ribosomal protein S19e [Candidatus Micrarchaeota archaeon CG10_big_fil_rev_8_21_14_0_10_60_32]PIO01787.1 MAG: 30S ribosomal protein S19e [Candidatus Micrarchaeota archaeon CG09_land_8_20_14_0_10_60_16]PIZ91182.1 MAG: 30S ribosomal protein S19e [Candidatus Micrarchaeota archaeon CG_4_10_14_0_2_um_filter_60_11]
MVMDIAPGKAVEKIAAKLEKDGLLKQPAWAVYKTGPARERVATEPGFWFKRAAGILRNFAANEGKPIGVQRLRNKYGGRRRHVVHRSHHQKAGGGVIRRVVQQLEQSGLVARKSKTSGRVITARGKKFVAEALK